MSDEVNRGRGVVAWGLLGLLTACNVTPPRNVSDRGAASSSPSDDWQRSVTWLHATSGAASTAAGECAHVRSLLLEEVSCRGRLCGPPSELVTEWRDKCSPDRPDPEIAEVEKHFERQLEELPTPCFADYRTLTEQDCQGKACRDRAQRWATRCAHTEGSELSLHIVETIVRRGSGSAELDPRSCEEIGEELTLGARCDDEADCRRAKEAVLLYDDRCIDPGQPLPLSVALQRMAIAAGAGDRPEPVAVKPGTGIPAGAVPLVLASGQGAVLTVCGRRQSTVESYLATRERCGGGPVSFAVLRAGGLAVTTLDPVGDLSIVEAFPKLALVEERAKLEEQRAASLTTALDEALASSSKLSGVARALDEHGFDLVSSAQMQRALHDRDAALVPIFTELAEAKIRHAERFTTLPEHKRGLLARGRSRPFADLRLDGQISPLAHTTVSLLDLEPWLPKSMAAYLDRLAPLKAAVEEANETQRKQQQWSGQSPDEEAAASIIAANKSCLAAQEDFASASRQLDDCVFGGCDDETILRLIGQRKAARAIAVATRHRYDGAAAMTEEPKGPFMCDPLH